MEIPASPLDASLLPDFDLEFLSNELLLGDVSLFQSPEYADPFSHHLDASDSISFFDPSLFSVASETTVVTNDTLEARQNESTPALLVNESFFSEFSGYPIKRSASSNQNGSVAGQLSTGEDRVPSSKLLIRGAPAQLPSLKERLMHALRCIKENSSGDVLVQIWVPTKKGGKHVLTTCGQPFALSSHSKRLMNYRTVSLDYFFPAEVKASRNEIVGLPGRVFRGQLPEWTPDVQYYSSTEYARVAHAHRYDIHGTLALPVFERDRRRCLVVLEVVMTTQKIKFASEVGNICAALQAVNLRSSEVLCAPSRKLSPTESNEVANIKYRDAIPLISEVLKVVCETHKLPLALTWISCIDQGKMGSRHSDDNYKNCVSTLDDACYVRDSRFWGFQEACSEHHLVKGEGITGMAFTANKPCFSANVTLMSREEYPMLHHAKLFGLRAAIAIRLRSIGTGIVDYVLEFFLPVNCIDTEEQRLMLNSLSFTLQRVSQGLRVVSDEEIQREIALRSTFPDLVAPSSSGMEEVDRISDEEVPDRNHFPELKRSRTDVVGGKHIDCQAYMPGGIQNPENETSSTLSSRNNCQLWLDNFQKNYHVPETNDVDVEHSSMGDVSSVSEIKVNERRRFKLEKMISLEVLQQYFAGSLKDAARNIGVCPTTLKRICRQYGIARWPSRNIKKVDHSIKKLQLVIDSVQGVGGTFRINSFYDSLPKGYESPMMKNTSSGKLFAGGSVPRESSSKKPDSKSGVQNSSKSTSACSQGSSSGHSCPSPSEEKCKDDNLNSMVEEGGGHSELVLPAFTPAESLPVRSHVNKHHSEQPLMNCPPAKPQSSNTSGNNSLIRLKVAFGDEIIRFKFPSTLGFHDLREEIAKRFFVKDANAFDLKYLDDDSEWVSLRCNEDFRECMDSYNSSNARVIKLSFHRSVPLSS